MKKTAQKLNKKCIKKIPKIGYFLVLFENSFLVKQDQKQDQNDFRHSKTLEKQGQIQIW